MGLGGHLWLGQALEGQEPLADAENEVPHGVIWDSTRHSPKLLARADDVPQQRFLLVPLYGESHFHAPVNLLVSKYADPGEELLLVSGFIRTLHCNI